MVQLPGGTTMTVPGSYQEQFTVTAGRLDDAAREASANWLNWPWFGRTALSSTSTAHMLPRPCPARKGS
ncbi:hypothetical protein ACOT81_38320 [Streptomyces sp. WI04-05B]|uniref:hypothetical protein n=1 Tax=Streptomyces TaxID=1883 RepID=UPI0029AFE681|nr:MULTISPECIES: hypothetical protein [unclassified Streptomyces]MDX2545920.1 hypothetical protein [Streptomyces sp. WI04-05B]MDX2586479.1 hypothetical protein [Streptomyces sp. WI04-05A]